MPRRWSRSDLVRTSSGAFTAKATATGSSPSPVSLNRKLFQGLVLGIDPSLRGTGLALVHSDGRHFQLVHSCTLRPRSVPHLALGHIAAAVASLCDKHRPAAAAVEESIFAQNPRTALTLGAARGAILATLALQGIPAHGFAPARIKLAVAAHGRASKEQVAAMTRRLLSLKETLSFDEADAAATALCFILTYRV